MKQILSKNFLASFWVLVFVLIFSGQAIAIPNLVVTTWPSDNVIYGVGEGNKESFPDYLAWFLADSSNVWIGNDNTEGFYLNSNLLTVVTSYNPHETDIFLIVEGANIETSATYAGDPLEDGAGFIKGAKGGYKPTYLYVELNNDDLWYRASDIGFSESEYWFHTAPFEIRGWSRGHYIFAAANINNKFGLQFSGSEKKDDFSPKATSTHFPEPAKLLLRGGKDDFSTKTTNTLSPEPATLFLLGIGLIGVLFTKKYIL